MDSRKRSGKAKEWGGGGGGFKRKRDLTPEKPEEPTLEELVIQFAGNVRGFSDFDNAVQELRENLLTEYELQGIDVKELLTKCALNMPYKMTVFSALVGLMNLKNYSFGSEFADHLLACLLDFLKKGHWEDAQIIVIFLCSLVNSHCISSASCMTVLESFLSVVEDEDNKPIQRDLCFSFILRTLPAVGEFLSNEIPDALESLFKTLEQYALSRDSGSYLRLIQVWNTDKPHLQEEFLDCLWLQIKDLRAKEWSDTYYMHYEKSHNILLANSVAHSVADFSVAIGLDMNDFPVRKAVFRMFDPSDCPEGRVLPDAHSIERFLLEQDLMWLIDKNYTDPKKCAVELSNYYCRGDIPLSYITLEIIFGLMFRLPKPPKIELFYGCLLIELCKAQVYTVPQVVAQATEILFQRLACMNIACIDRFVNWFAFHLSNFRYCWTWSDWTSCCDHEPYSPQLCFVTELLARCQTFSYHERIVEILPDELKHLLPPAPRVFNKFAVEGSKPSGLALELQNAIKAHKEPEKVLSILEDEESIEIGDGSGETTEYKTEVMISLLLVHGQKAMSQTLSLITRFAPVLDQLAKDNENAQLSLLNGVVEAWPTFEQRIAVVVDKLLRLEIVQAPTIVKWVFSKEMKKDFLKQYVWEIVFSTFDKLCNNYRVLACKLEASMKEEGSLASSEEPTATFELQQGLEACLGSQKAFIFTLFQHFIIALSEHLLTVDEGGDTVSDWYRIVFGRMCQFFAMQCIEIHRYRKELGEVLFTGDLDSRINEPYKWFLAFMN